MNQAAIDKLTCVMTQSMSKALLNESWGVECDVDKLREQAISASALLFLMDRTSYTCTVDSDGNTTDVVDITTLGIVDRVVNSVTDTAHFCSTDACEEKLKTTTCSGITVTDTSATKAGFLITDVSATYTP